jgi:hypothetical protein
MAWIRTQAKKIQNHIRLEGQWNDYMLHATHVTWVGNIYVLPIITFLCS